MSKRTFSIIKIVAVVVGSMLALTLELSAADCTAKITGVHLCCKSCVTGAEQAVATVQDAKAVVDQDAGTITLSGPNSRTVQKAADALVAAGYFGKASDDSVKVVAKTGAKGKKVASAKVVGVHLCCAKCVKAVDKAVTSVSGAKSHTATKGAKSFEVTGEFDDQELMTALQKEGLTGKIEK